MIFNLEVVITKSNNLQGVHQRRVLLQKFIAKQIWNDGEKFEAATLCELVNYPWLNRDQINECLLNF